MVQLPDAEAFSGPDGVERLHQSLDDILKSLPEGIVETVNGLNDTIAELQETIAALQTQVNAIPIWTMKTEIIDAAATSQTFVHGSGTKDVMISMFVDSSPTHEPWAVEVDENTVGVNFAATPATPLRINVLSRD